MDKAYNDSIRPYLDLAEKLRVILKGTSIKIPRIASCGMQSHGKSSTLESITHINLPKGDGTVTVCPIKVQLRNVKGNEFARIKFEDEKDDKYVTIDKLDDIAEKINQYQNIVKNKYGVKDDELKLFDEVIEVEVNRNNAPNLTLIDLPGLNFNPKIKEDSEKINEKYLKEEETTVLLVLSASEEITNSFATEFMKKIPNYQKRFNAIISKADYLKDKNLNEYMKQINLLGLINKPSLIINKSTSGETSNLSFEEMIGKEKEILNNIKDIEKYPEINKGIEELITQLILIQKKDITNAFSNISFQISKDIKENQEIINKLPKELKDMRTFYSMLEECIRKFDNRIKKKMEVLKCNFDGSPKENLMQYHIQMRFKEHIVNTKNKISFLLSEAFCKEVTENIIQYNSDNISILEDTHHFNILLKPKIEVILSEFDSTIKDIFDYMISQIKNEIDESFKIYAKLKEKVNSLYEKYAEEQKNHVIHFYKEIYYLETENISTHNIDVMNKVNNINRYINYFLFGNEMKKKNIDKNIEDKKKEEEKPKEEEVKQQEEDKKDSNNKDNENEIKKKNEEDELLEEGINYNYNYEDELTTRYDEYDEFKGRIKIAYVIQDISTVNERIENLSLKKFDGRKGNYVFIPGFQYIEKEQLINFQQLIKRKLVKLQTANIITKMIAYLEITLNRVLDIIFLSIKKYLYDRLTDEDMISHIRNEIHLLDFTEAQQLMEISAEISQLRKECQEKLKKLTEARDEINNLKNKNNNRIFTI